jgi:hypothetical protein
MDAEASKARLRGGPLASRSVDAKRVQEEVIHQLGTTPPEDYEERMNAEQRTRLTPYVPLIFGTVLLFGAAIAFGIFIGWLIWA